MRQYTSCPWCDATDKADRRSRFGCVQCQHEFHSESNLASAAINTSATLINALNMVADQAKEIAILKSECNGLINVGVLRIEKSKRQDVEIERLKAANNTIKVEIADVYASNESYRIELERVRGLIKQHLTHHENGCVYLDEALLCKN